MSESVIGKIVKIEWSDARPKHHAYRSYGEIVEYLEDRVVLAYRVPWGNWNNTETIYRGDFISVTFLEPVKKKQLPYSEELDFRLRRRDEGKKARRTYLIDRAAKGIQDLKYFNDRYWKK